MPQITCDQCAFWNNREGGVIKDAFGYCKMTQALNNDPVKKDTMAIAVVPANKQLDVDDAQANVMRITSIMRTHRKYSCPVAEKGDAYA